MSMRRLSSWTLFACLIALASSLEPSDAAVMIRSFQVKICVTGAKHPDACKSAGADATVVVSEETLDRFAGQIGQGATIEAIPEKGMAQPADAQSRRRKHTGD
jgi:hypothetical protein